MVVVVAQLAPDLELAPDLVVVVEVVAVVEARLALDRENVVDLEKQRVDPPPESGVPPRQPPRQWQRMRLQWQQPMHLLKLKVALRWFLAADEANAFQALAPETLEEVEAVALGPWAPLACTHPFELCDCRH